MEVVLPQIIFQAINFFILFGALSFLIYRPIMKIFQDRAKRIEDGQRAAQEAIEQQALLSEMEQQKRLEMEQKMADLLEDASNQAQEHKNKLMERAKLDAAEYQQKQRIKWDQEKSQLLLEYRHSMVDAVILATEKVIQNKLTKSDKSEMIDRQLDEVLSKI